MFTSCNRNAILQNVCFIGILSWSMLCCNRDIILPMILHCIFQWANTCTSSWTYEHEGRAPSFCKLIFVQPEKKGSMTRRPARMPTLTTFASPFSVLNVLIPLLYHCTFNGSQQAKLKKTIPVILLHEIYRVEAVCLKNSDYTLKITFFVNMWNLGQFLEKQIICQ